MKQALPSSLIAAGVMISIVAVWILSGLFSSNAKPAIAPSDMAAVGTSFAVPRVRTRVITAEERMVHLTVNGRTQAHRTVVVKAETAGQVAEVLVKKGEQVAAGQVMVRLKEEERPARLAEARALVRRRAVEHEAAKALEQKAFASRIRLAEAEAELDAARAQLVRIQIDLDRTALRAPFAGLVETRPVEVGDFVPIGGTIATVVDLEPVVVVAEVTERDVAAITPGMPAEAVLISGERLAGTVSYVATVATPVTRTFPVEVTIANSPGTVPAGLTAEAHLPLRQRLLYAVPPSTLTLDETGRVGIKTVTESDLVTFHPVTIVDSGSDGMLWVVSLSLPPIARLITVGQEFVRIGQKVEAVPEAPLVDGTTVPSGPAVSGTAS